MSEKNLNSRIILKHDTEANWNKATNFIPKQGELIIYDKDNTYNYERLKIGDGTLVVKSLPFILAEDLTLLSENLTSLSEEVDKKWDLNSRGASISSSTINDLNILTTPGTYYSANTANTSGIINCPVASGFTIVVIKGYSANYFYQIIFSPNNGYWYRVCSGGTWGDWVNVLKDTTYTLSSFGITSTASELNYVDGVTSNIQTQLNNKAPKAHASTATTYGKGTSSNYGHVKISDSTSSTSAASDGIAASPKAVKSAYDLANTANTGLSGKADKNQGVFYIEGTGSTAGTWLGSHADITEYYNGLTILYKIAVAGAATTTLNLNNLGAVTVVRNATTAISTACPVNGILLLTYTVDSDGTSYWKTADYDSNTKTTTGTSNKTGTKLFLAGASSQASSATTYSNSNVYIGTDNSLYSNGVKVATTSDLSEKQDTIVGGASTIVSDNLTASRALVSNSSGKIAVSAVTSTELGYLDGVTSSIQTQLTGKAPTSHASSNTTYGVSSASNYGHAMASSTTPKANGTAAVGSETAKFARGDHVHPLQTSVSGNAGTATKLASAKTISLTGDVTGSASFDGSANVSITANVANDSHSHSNYAPYATRNATTAATAGWYRIATSAASISNCNAIFSIVSTVSGRHSSVIITAGTSYGVTNSSHINVLQCSHYSGQAITKARIVYHTTYSDNYAYLEIYQPTATATSVTVKMIAGTGWSLVAPNTAGSIPSGYSNKEVTLTDATITATSFAGSGASLTSLNASNITSGTIAAARLPAATTSAQGAMTAAMVTKLNGIAAGANAYTLPTASSTLGGVKTTSTVTSTSGLTACPIISGVPYYKDTNNTYTLSSFGITATSTELNKMDGVTATTTELNYVDGVTSNIQTQLNGKASTSVATTSANGLMSATDKTKLDATNIAYGTCPTAAATAAKVITISGNTNWKLTAGSLIVVKFTYTNSASNPTFNVNNTGAKSVLYGTSAITTSSLSYAGYANRYCEYVYDGTQYVFVGWSYDTNTTYSNASLGQGYGTCATAAATVEKAVTLSSYSLTTGGVVSVKFTYAVPASATLNINSKGAKAIYHKGAAIKAGIIGAGDTATFIYNGTYYHLLSIDKTYLETSKIVYSETEPTGSAGMIWFKPAE